MKFPGRKPAPGPARQLAGEPDQLREDPRQLPAWELRDAPDPGPNVDGRLPAADEPLARRPVRLSGLFTVDPRRLVNISQPGKSVTVGASSTLILALNEARIFATIVNDSANDVYITLGRPAVSARGIRLNANGGSLVFGLATDIPYLGVVYGIASASSNVTVTES